MVDPPSCKTINFGEGVGDPPLGADVQACVLYAGPSHRSYSKQPTVVHRREPYAGTGSLLSLLSLDLFCFLWVDCFPGMRWLLFGFSKKSIEMSPFFFNLTLLLGACQLVLLAVGRSHKPLPAIPYYYY